MIKIAIFASGNGSNAENIIKYFRNSDSVKTELVLSNNPNAFVLERARKLSVDTMVFGRKELYETFEVIDILVERAIDFIVLAGFMWLVPKELTDLYKGKIVNIHPALLPKYGGKGMYGMNVHKAVLAAKERETGITIHLVDEKYDNGQIIFQAKCPVLPGDTPETLAQRVHELEYKYYPLIIEQLTKNLTHKNQ